ncbi:tyrosine-type recombinase/integrase [Polaromonas naphthalenivorans]|uniref:Phage integrase n=1 Tax=Polaromonas naphthalenivorans (strain CJ2) TaxID=365044 RepID=A1VW14_POLNA|nr:integrase [Polaromonas naphthalenivorans]ABM39842.1 phage integrase [Polaromonas naphthalenivorans CJ2]
MADATAVDPDAFFASWQAARLANKDLKPMGAAGLQQASLVWRHWLAFCTVHAIAWDAAQSADIALFCQSISPRSSLKKTSPVTRRRYWRVLRDLYDHALVGGLVAVNPAEGAQPPATERVPSLALSGPMWTALREGLYDGFPGGDDFKARRNRLALLLMMRAALTVREIISLTLDCTQPCADSPEAHAGPSPLYLLLVRKAGGGHERVLQLDPETSRALHAWLEVRPVGLPALHPGSRLVVGDRIGRSIAPNGLYNICQAHLARCLVEKGLLAEQVPHATLDPGALAHMGPNTLRNTCIAGWFNAGVPLQEIQRRCGFKDASVMSRLGAHLVSPFPL